jgi:zinc protease
MTDNLRTNAYWGMTVLSDAQQNPARIVAARDRAADILAITREELGALAQQHLAPRQAFKFVTVQAPPH